MTAVALLGFSASGQFWQLCLWSVPYGLGAGSVDAALNNFVALHYESRHMSWLHCFWGVGCSTGPYVMSYFLTNGHEWNEGYFSIFVLQIILTLILVFSLPLWKQKSSMKSQVENPENTEVLGMKRTMAIKGVKEVMLTFLCYCAIEQTAGLWAVSYVVFEKGISADQAAKLGSIFFLGITIGRFLSGFLTEKFSDSAMVKLGEAIIVCGIIATVLPWNCRNYNRLIINWFGVRSNISMSDTCNTGAFWCQCFPSSYRYADGECLCRYNPYAAFV